MSFTTALHAPRIFDGEIWHDDKVVLIEDGKVTGLTDVTPVSTDVEVTELETGCLVPGFVDLQVNGGGGVLLNNDPSVAGIRTICAAHAKFGTTALLPTLITDTDKVRNAAIAAGIAAAKHGVPGFAGLHLEGPHLSQARKGAHDPALIRPMTNADVEILIAARQSLPALVVTVAAESVSPEQVRALVAGGVRVSIGHCDAGLDEVQALADAGATMVTHLFNAMSQMTGREPGMVGAALTVGGLSASLICDGYHVHPDAVSSAMRAKAGPGHIFLISDAMATVGTDMKAFTLNGRKIWRAEGKLTLDDGTLAGADLELATAVRILHKQVGVDLAEALRMAALYPTQLIGALDMGRIAPGCRANFVWLDAALMPQQTWISGKCVAVAA